MGGAGKRFDCRFDGFEGGVDQAPFAPTTFDALSGQNDVWVIGKGVAKLVIVGLGRPRVEVDRHDITHGSQLACLSDNRGHVLVAK